MLALVCSDKSLAEVRGAATSPMGALLDKTTFYLFTYENKIGSTIFINCYNFTLIPVQF